ncbi:MAG: exonuclease domain-containing protein [Oscillospiraceae bacterium]|nr:exonuclease domain-containing protein [Oscillospiraceae bacterium]
MDLEWNQARSMRDVVADSAGNKLYGEIIQIGAVKLSDKFRVADTLKINVKPKYYKVMHRKVRQITGISQEDLARGENFLDAIEKLRVWCGDDFAFLTWGPDDIRILRRNIEMYGEKSEWIDRWFDLQMIYNMQTESGENQKSLTTAVEHFGIEAEDPMHDALNDAYYTALVAAHLDIPFGVSELLARARKKAIFNEDRPLMCEVYGGYSTRRDIFADRDISEIRCPECGAVCRDRRKWVSEGNERYITLASCEEHGGYVVRLRAEKRDEGYEASKTVYTAGEGAESYYEKRAKKESARKSRRKRRAKSAAPRKTVQNQTVEKVNKK